MTHNPESSLSQQEVSIVAKIKDFYSSKSEKGRKLSPKERSVIESMLEDTENVDAKFKQQVLSILTDSKATYNELSHDVTRMLQETSQDFKDSLENGKKSHIKSIQGYLKTSRDGILGVGTFTRFQKSPLAQYFSLGDIASGTVTDNPLWEYAARGKSISSSVLKSAVRRISALIAKVSSPQGKEKELALAYLEIQNSDLDIHGLQQALGFTPGNGLDGDFGPTTFGKVAEKAEEQNIEITEIVPFVGNLVNGNMGPPMGQAHPPLEDIIAPVTEEENNVPVEESDIETSSGVVDQGAEVIEEPGDKFLQEVQKYLFQEVGIDSNIIVMSLDSETGKINITLQDGTQKEIDVEDDTYIYARFLSQAVRDKSSAFPDKRALAEAVSEVSKEDREKLQRVLGIDEGSVDGVFGRGTYSAFMESPLSDIMSIEDMFNLTKIEGDDIVSFIPNGEIQTGDFVLVDEATGAITIFNAETQKFQISASEELKDGLKQYNSYKVFSQDFAKLSESEKQNFLKNVFLIDADIADAVSLFEAVSRDDIFAEFDVPQIADGVKYSGDNEHLVSIFGKFGFNEAFFESMDVQQGEFLTYDEERQIFLITFDGNNVREYNESLVLRSSIESGNIEVILNFLNTSADPEATIANLKQEIARNREDARALFTDGTDFPVSLNFHGSRKLESALDAFDLFGDKEYLKKRDVVYRNTGEGFVREQTVMEKIFSGAFASNDGKLLAINRKTTLDQPTPDEIEMYNEDITFRKLFQIFEQAKGKVEKQQLGDFMKKMIAEKKFFAQTREKFTKGNDTDGYSVDLQGYNFLTAYELFGDKGFVQDMKSGEVYKKNDTRNSFYSKTIDRLSIDDQSTLYTLVDNTDTFASIDDSIILKDREGFTNYFSGLDEKEGKKVLVFLRKMLAENPALYQNMRDMFAPGNDTDGYIVDLGENTFLGAQDLFGDIPYLTSGSIGGVENIIQRGGGKNFYSLVNGKRLSLLGGEKIFPKAKEDIDFSKYILKGDKNVRKIRGPRFRRNPKTRTTLCARSAMEFANKVGYKGTPWSGYAFEQFHNMGGPKIGRVPTMRRPNTASLGLGEMEAFLKTNRVKAAQIYLDAGGKYIDKKSKKQVYYGHVATIVLDKSGKYFVFDAYNGRKGAIPLKKYYTDRRLEVSKGHGKRRRFKGIAKLG